MQEPLLKNSHNIYIGQAVRVIDNDVIDLYSRFLPNGSPTPESLNGVITDIDGEDIRIRADVVYPTESGTESIDLGGWNINFSVLC
jgi:hypothetical protein